MRCSTKATFSKTWSRRRFFRKKEPCVSWQRLEAVITKAKRENRITRSSNYYSVTLKDVMPRSGHVDVKLPTDSVARDRADVQDRGSRFCSTWGLCLIWCSSFQRSLDGNVPWVTTTSSKQSLVCLQSLLFEVLSRSSFCGEEDRLWHHRLVGDRLPVLLCMVRNSLPKPVLQSTSWCTGEVPNLVCGFNAGLSRSVTALHSQKPYHKRAGRSKRRGMDAYELSVQNPVRCFRALDAVVNDCMLSLWSSVPPRSQRDVALLVVSRLVRGATEHMTVSGLQTRRSRAH